MLSYNGDAKLKEAVLEEIQRHIDAEEIGHGYYSIFGSRFKTGVQYCAVGCTIQSLMDLGILWRGSEHSQHELYEVIGIPRRFALIEDQLHETLPAGQMETWPYRFAEAMPVGVDLGQHEAALIAAIDPRIQWLESEWVCGSWRHEMLLGILNLATYGWEDDDAIAASERVLAVLRSAK